MKLWHVYYAPRGYRFSRPSCITVRAYSKCDARMEAIIAVGDVYVVRKVEEIKVG